MQLFNFERTLRMTAICYPIFTSECYELRDKPCSGYKINDIKNNLQAAIVEDAV